MLLLRDDVPCQTGPVSSLIAGVVNDCFVKFALRNSQAVGIGWC